MVGFLEGGAPLYASPGGVDSGGTLAKPASIGAALASGRDVYLMDGVYTVSYPLDVQKNVHVQPVLGARPVITHADGYPPEMRLHDNSKIDGVWIGGNYDPNIYDQLREVRALGRNVVVQQCTFFGYLQCIVDQMDEGNNIYRNNRFVRIGYPFAHAFYITIPYDGLPHRSGAKVLDNLVVRNYEGASVDVYRQAHGVEVAGNFIEGETGNGLFSSVENLHVHDNVFGRSLNNNKDWICHIQDTAEGLIFDHNFLIGNYRLPIPPASITVRNNVYFNQTADARDTNPTEITDGGEVAYLGMSDAEIAAICDALEMSFSQPVQAISSDTTIEKNFGLLKDVVNVWTS